LGRAAELVEAGWLEVMPLPASRRREQGALKVLRWPKREGTTPPLTAGMTLAAPNSPADSGSTFTGNQSALRASGEANGSPSQDGAPRRCPVCHGESTAAEGELCRTCSEAFASGDEDKADARIRKGRYARGELR
jgi:hypothetical protein